MLPALPSVPPAAPEEAPRSQSGVAPKARPALPAPPGLFFDWTPILTTHYVAAWLALGAIALGASVALAWIQSRFVLGWEEWRGLLPSFAQIAGATAIPIAIRFCYGRVVRWGDSLDTLVVDPGSDVTGWFRRELALAARRAPMWAGGLAFTLVGLVAWHSAGVSSPPFFATVLVASFFAGVAIVYVAAFGRIVWRLGDTFPIKVEDHRFGVRSAGRILVECWLAAALIWATITSSAVFEKQVPEWPLFLLAVPTAIVFLTTFVACQLPLHDRMVDYKRREFVRWHAALSDLLGKGLDRLSEEEMTRVGFLEDRLDQIAKLPEWPTDWVAFTRLSASSLLLNVLAVVAKHASEQKHGPFELLGNLVKSWTD